MKTEQLIRCEMKLRTTSQDTSHTSSTQDNSQDMDLLRQEHQAEVTRLTQEVTSLARTATAVHREFLEVKAAYLSLRRHVTSVPGDVVTEMTHTRHKVSSLNRQLHGNVCHLE